MVLVTGAAGNLGSATCEQLKLAGIEFRATDIHTHQGLGYRVIVENLLRREACYQLIEGCDAVVHLANHTNERASTPQAVFGENCTMNMNIFQAALDLGVKKVLFASSVQVISGNRRARERDEKPSSLAYLPADGNLPAMPGNCYSASKVSGELLLKSMVEYRGLPSGISVRFPGLSRPEWFDWMRRHSKIEHIWKDEYIDEAAAYLTFADGGRLVAAILKAELPGYRCYFPAHTSPRFVDPIPDILQRFYPNVPRKSEHLASLVDISRITAETGWVPQEDVLNAPQPAAKAS